MNIDPMNINHDNLISVKDAAMMLGVTYASIMQEINRSGAYQGQYCVQVGHRIFLPTDWIRYLKGRRS
jgi:hypothetical protein